MSDVADYDTDILLWSERQAALLRGLRTRAPNVPNELDIENVAEEIESVGRSELRAAESFLTQMIIHLVKAASTASDEPLNHWFSEIRTFRRGFENAATPSMLQRISLDQLWKRAYRDARDDLLEGGQPALDLPEACPFGLEEIRSPDVHPRDLTNRLRQVASAPR